MTRTWQVTRGQLILNYVESDSGYQVTVYYQYATPSVLALQGFYSPTAEGLQQQVKEYLSSLSMSLQELIDVSTN